MHSLSQHKEYEPSVDLVTEDECDTILLFLPGFEKKHIRAQVSTNRKLKVSGQGPDRDGYMKSFQKEFQLSENCEINGITAIFDNDILYVRQSKVITTVTAEQERDCRKRNNGQSIMTTDLNPKHKSVQHQTINPESDYKDSLGGVASNKGDERYKYYNQVLAGLAMEMKRRRKMYSFFVVALSLALLFTLCAATCELRQI